MKRAAARFVASGLGSGYAPVAPGTVGSLVAMALGVAMLHLAPAALPFAVIGATLAGLWSVRAAGVEDDPGWVVIDEFAGMWIAMLPYVVNFPSGIKATKRMTSARMRAKVTDFPRAAMSWRMRSAKALSMDGGERVTYDFHLAGPYLPLRVYRIALRQCLSKHRFSKREYFAHGNHARHEQEQGQHDVSGIVIHGYTLRALDDALQFPLMVFFDQLMSRYQGQSRR